MHAPGLYSHPWGQMLLILVRILFPLDPSRGCANSCATGWAMVMGWVADPEELEAYAYWSEGSRETRKLHLLSRIRHAGPHPRDRRPPDAGPAIRPRPVAGQTPHPPPQEPEPAPEAPRTALARDFHHLGRARRKRADRMRRERYRFSISCYAAIHLPALRAVEANHHAESPSASHCGSARLRAETRRRVFTADACARADLPHHHFSQKEKSHTRSHRVRSPAPCASRASKSRPRCAILIEHDNDSATIGQLFNPASDSVPPSPMISRRACSAAGFGAAAPFVWGITSRRLPQRSSEEHPPPLSPSP